MLNLILFGIGALFGYAYLSAAGIGVPTRVFNFPTTTTFPETEIIPPEIAASHAEPPETLFRPNAATVAQAYKFGPLSQQEIAEGRAKCGFDDPNIKLVMDYPGFVRRPDGLLQWDGKTAIPPGFEGIFAIGTKDAQAECSAEVARGEGRSTMESCTANITKNKWMIDALRSGRPFCPGIDLSYKLPKVEARARAADERFARITGGRIGSGSKTYTGKIFNSRMPQRIKTTLSRSFGQTQVDAMKRSIEQAARPRPIRTNAERAAAIALGKAESVARDADQAAMHRRQQEREADMQRWIAEENVEEQALKNQRRAAETTSYFGGRTRNRRVEYF